MVAIPGKKAGDRVTGTTVVPGVVAATAATAEIEAREAGAVTVEIAADEAATAGTGVRETVGLEMTAVSDVILTMTVTAHALIETKLMVPGSIAAYVVDVGVPVVMMGADDGQARRVDNNDATTGPFGQRLIT